VTSVAAWTPAATMACDAARLSRPMDSHAACRWAASAFCLRAAVVMQPVPSGFVR
jgi:hypothetical protein